MTTSRPSRRLQIERDSVCAADDCLAPHLKSIAVQPDCSLGQFLQTILEAGCLPRIAGGRATWTAQSGGRPLAVIAQQWSEPQFLVEPDTRMTDCIDWDGPVALVFRYWSQADPELVFQCLRNGKPMPDPQGGFA